jgi:hypothetical protein
MLPILTVLFLISYGLMTMLIVEQSSTIESQRALIRELFRDSNELSAVKEKGLQNAQTQALGKVPSSQLPSAQVQTPSTQMQHSAPSTQVPANHAPQARTQKTDKIANPFTPPPTRPAQDQADDRRALILI